MNKPTTAADRDAFITSMANVVKPVLERPRNGTSILEKIVDRSIGIIGLSCMMIHHRVHEILANRKF